MSTSRAQAAAFFREIARTHTVWWVRDDAGSPAPVSRSGQPAFPYWSSQTRARRAAHGLSGFARRLTNDLGAVAASLTLRWSSGGTEGAVNRIKKDQEAAVRARRMRLSRKMILLA